MDCNKKNQPLNLKKDFFSGAINSILISVLLPKIFSAEEIVGLSSIVSLVTPLLGYWGYNVYLRFTSPDYVAETISRLKKDKKTILKQLKDSSISQECKIEMKKKYDEICLRLSTAHSDLCEVSND